MNSFGASKLSLYPLCDEDKVMTISLATNDFIRDSAALIIDYKTTIDSVTNDAMGIISNSSQCSTCSAVSFDPCNGHFGAIHLPIAIPNPNINEFVGIIVNCWCTRNNGHIIFGDQERKRLLHLPKELRHKEAIKLYKKAIKNGIDKCFCTICQDTKEGPVSVIYNMPYKSAKTTKPMVIGFRNQNFSNDGKFYLINPNKIHDYVKSNISQVDISLFGVDYPLDSLFLTYIPMVPNNMRYQSLEIFGGQNPLSAIYNLLKIRCKEIYNSNPTLNNNELFEFKELEISTTKGLKDVTSIIESLKSLIVFGTIILTKATYDQSAREQLYANIGSRTVPGIPVSTIASALGKQGLFRRVINGCRVDMSGRSVLTCGPYLSINQLGIPSQFAKTMTVEVLVTDYNIDYLRPFVANGPNEYPGANEVYIDNKLIKIKDDNKMRLAQSLSIGSTVFRHLVNDDIVLCNRYPTLREESFGCHKVWIDPKKNVFSLTMGNCKKMNGDFDGDEIQTFKLPSQENCFEALALLSPANQLISYKDGASIVGGAKDLESGINILKRDEFTIREVVQIFKNKRTEDDARILYNILFDRFGKKDLYCGLEIASTLLPFDLNYVSPDKKIIIENSVFKSIHKSIADLGSLFTCYLSHKYNGMTAISFIDQFMNLIYAVNEFAGSSNPTNWILPKEYRAKIKDMTNTLVENVDDLYNKCYQGYVSIIDEKNIDVDVHNAISKCQIDVKNLIAEAIKDTRFYKDGIFQSVEAETLKACGFLGQQQDEVYGKLKPTLASGTRILSTFPRFNRLARAQGLITSNYVEGNSPIGVFYEALVGRHQLYTKTQSVGESGYFERQLAKNLINEKATYNSIVYGDSNSIVSFGFGFDGINGKNQHIDYIYPLNFKDNEIADLYKAEGDEYIKMLIYEKNKYHKYFIESYKTSPIADNLSIYNKSKPINELDYMQSSENFIRVILPLDIQNLVRSIPESTESPMSAKDQQMKIKRLCTKIVASRITSKLSDFMIKQFLNQTYQLRLYILFNLCSTGLRLSSSQFDWLESQIRVHYMEALIPPGDAVGLKAGYTITEPISQGRLNAIHAKTSFDGEVSKIEKADAMTRVKQLLLGGTDTPIIKITIKERYDYNKCKEFAFKYNSVLINELDPSISVYISSNFDKILDMFHSKEKRNTYFVEETTFMIVSIKKELSAYHFANPANIESALDNGLGDIVTGILYEDIGDQYIFYLAISPMFDGQFGGLESRIKNLQIGNGLFYNAEIKPATELFEDEGQLKLREYYQILANLPYVQNCGYINPFSKVLILDEVDQEFTTTNSPSYIMSTYGIAEGERKMYEELSDVLTNGDMNKHTASIESRNIKMITETILVSGRIESFTRHGMLNSTQKDFFTTVTFENSEKALQTIVANTRPIELNNSVSSILYNSNSSLGTDIIQTYLNIAEH